MNGDVEEFKEILDGSAWEVWKRSNEEEKTYLEGGHSDDPTP